MSQITQSISSLKTYVSWYNTGQEQQTGLDINPFIDLNTGCTSALNQLTIINSGILAFKNSWNQFIQNPVTNMASVFEQGLAILQQEADTLIGTASSTKSKAENLSSTVSGQINTLKIAIENYNKQYQQAENDYNNAVNQYNDANSQLSGSSGFWNGFLTGITAGIYNKLKQEMDAANNARDNARASINAIQQILINSNNTHDALNSCKSTVNELNDLMNGLTDIQNGINTTATACKQGAQDEHNAANANDLVVIDVFIKLATSQVQTLISLGDELNSSI